MSRKPLRLMSKRWLTEGDSGIPMLADAAAYLLFNDSRRALRSALSKYRKMESRARRMADAIEKHLETNR